jgi:hypothetical protein
MSVQVGLHNPSGSLTLSCTVYMCGSFSVPFVMELYDFSNIIKYPLILILFM